MASATATADLSGSKDSDGPRTLTDLAYGNLRDDIIHGHLSAGSKLRIEALRERYNVGATPLREALSRLSADGFVTASGQRGFKVAELTVEDLLDLSDLRVLMETRALRQSITRGDDAWESRVVAAFHQLSKYEGQAAKDVDEWERRNHEFHLALISACSSRWLRRFYEVLYDQHKRYRNASRAAAPPGRDIHAEHTAIYEAALERDADAACAANEVHIRRTADVVSQLMTDDLEAAAKAKS